ncbi:unnamed protein product [Closterium sp. Naga37s-1]|nr:unnamed protein product [Closterium sp. Naga37s-1]
MGACAEPGPLERDSRCSSTLSPPFLRSQPHSHHSSRHSSAHPLTASSHFASPYASVLCAISLSPTASWPRLTMRNFGLPRLWLLLTVFTVASLGFVAVRLHPTKPRVAAVPARAARVMLDQTREGVCGNQIRDLGRSNALSFVTRFSVRAALVLLPLRLSSFSQFAPLFRPSPHPRASVVVRTLKEVLDGALTAAGGDPSAAAALAAALEEEYGGPSGLPDPDRPFPEAPQQMTAGAEDGGDGKSAAENVVEASAASSLSRTVIVTALSEAWAPMMRFFLDRLRLVEQQGRAEGEAEAEGGLNRLVDRLVVVAYDDASFDECCSLGLHCYFDWQDDAEEKEDFSGDQKHFMTPAYIHLVWRKVHVVRSMLALGYDVVFTDNDILWLRNPLPQLLLAAPEDMHMSVDWWNADSRKVMGNGGFYAARSNTRMLKFFDDWIAWHKRLPKHRIQQIFDWIRPEANPFTRTATPLTVRYLPTAHFGGFCEMGARMAELVTVHATCCFGLDSKLRVLRKVAADWDWMRALPHDVGEGLEEHGFAWQRRSQPPLETAGSPPCRPMPSAASFRCRPCMHGGLGAALRGSSASAGEGGVAGSRAAGTGWAMGHGLGLRACAHAGAAGRRWGAAERCGEDKACACVARRLACDGVGEGESTVCASTGAAQCSASDHGTPSPSCMPKAAAALWLL